MFIIMADEYPPGKFEAELQEIGELTKIVYRARRRGHPLGLLEDFIRKRKETLNGALRRNKDLRTRLWHIQRIQQRKTDELRKQTQGICNVSEEFRRAAAIALTDTANALQISTTANITEIKDEIQMKSEACVD